VPSLTLDSPIRGLPTVTWTTASAAFVAHHSGPYTAEQVGFITRLYTSFAPSIGLDPMVALAQMALETGWLTSYWSAPGRHNPAGIGVTGAIGAGIVFPTWVDSMRAHTGRLLAYSIPLGQGNERQVKLIVEALSWRTLANDRRGSATTIRGLAMTWAQTADYGERLVRISSTIAGFEV
jgi:hypothetical protein